MSRSEPNTVEVWLPEYPVIPYLLSETRKQADRFNALHPEYQVRIRGLEFTKLPHELYLAAANGTAPAVAQLFYTSTQLARDLRDRDGAPLFTPIGSAVDGRSEILGHPVMVDDVVRTAREFYTFDGVVTATPPLTSTTLLYTNLDLLAEAGVEREPRTWAELDAACAAVTARTGGPAVTWPNHGWFFQQAVAQQGAPLVDNDNGRSGRPTRVELDSAAMLAYVQWWRRSHERGHYLYTGVPGSGDRTANAYQENYLAFARRQVAFVLSTSVEADRMVRAGADGGFAVRASRTPYHDAVPYAGNVIGGDSLWLNGGLDEVTREGALAFLQYLGTAANAAARHKFTGFMPVTRSAIALLEEQAWFDHNPHHRAAIEQLAASDGSPAALGALLGDFAGIQEVLTLAMHDVLAAGADPETRFARATADAQRLLDEYNAHCTGRVPGPWGSNAFRVG